DVRPGPLRDRRLAKRPSPPGPQGGTVLEKILVGRLMGLEERTHLLQQELVARAGRAEVRIASLPGGERQGLSEDFACPIHTAIASRDPTPMYRAAPGCLRPPG